MTEASQGSDKKLRVAQMINSGAAQAEAIDRGNGIWESRGVGNSYLVVTSESDVLINAGALADARRGKTLFSRISSNEIGHHPYPKPCKPIRRARDI